MLWWPAQGECIPARAARAGRLAQVQFVVVFSSISLKKYCPPPLNCAIMLPPLCSPPKHAIMPVMLPPPHYAEIYASLGRNAQWPYYESLLPMAMVGDHNTPPHDSSRPDAVESHHPCIVHGVMRPWLFHLAWIGRRLHPCYSHRLIRLVLKKISIELVGSSDLTRLILNSVPFALVQNVRRRLFAELSCKLFENNGCSHA